MIQSLSVSDIPCFDEDCSVLEPIKQVTLIYGPNGVGKSSIAKKISGLELSGQVQDLFDKNFVENILKPENSLPSVFVIRDADPSVQKRMDELAGRDESPLSESTRGEIPASQRAIAGLENQISIQEAQVNEAEAVAKDAIWNGLDSVPANLKFNFEGFRNNKTKLFKEVIDVEASLNSDLPKTPADLEEILESIGEVKTEALTPIPVLTGVKDLSEDLQLVLTRPIKSQADTTFGEFVEQLGNSDWVYQGLHYLHESRNSCPFCQQEVDVKLSDYLAQLFNAKFDEELQSVNIALDLERDRLQLLQKHVKLLQSRTDEISNELIACISKLEGITAARIDIIRSKLASPSSSVTVPEIEDCVAEIKAFEKSLNQKIDETNALRADRAESLLKLKNEVWRYFVKDVVSNVIATYKRSINGPSKAISSLVSKLEAEGVTLNEKKAELAALQQGLSSSLPTVQAINQTLSSLGFLNFSIRSLETDNSYELVRADGTIATPTLSEGERSFIAFLYYFHKLKQLHYDMSAENDVIAVIDDPVSSLDGDALFVISLLIKDLFNFCAQDTGRLKQVVLLTHNAYFYKEVAFISPRKPSDKNRSYFVLSKNGSGKSRFKHHELSPITSPYAQLWEQIKSARDDKNLQNSAWLPNAMRRILENYFRIIGGTELTDVINKIPEKDRIACQSLLNWAHDGSHTSPWDVDYSAVSSDASVQLHAFKTIFDSSGHSAHYKMMMQADTTV